MHATVDIPTLKQALAAVKPALRANDEVLTAARLEASGSFLTVAATDNELTIRTTVPAAVTTPGVATVDHKSLAKAVHGTGDIDLELRSGRLVAINGTTTLLPSIADGRFPRLVDDGRFSASYQLNVAALRRILPAAADEATRQFLTGILFDGSTVTATDSYRLHTVDMPGADLPRMIVPARAVKAMLRSVPARATTVTMLAADETVQFRVSGSPLSWSVRLIADRYPPLDHLFSRPSNRLVAEREAMLAVLDAAVSQMRTVYDEACFTLEPGGDAAVAMEKAGEDTWESMLSCFYTGEANEVSFNPNLLRDAVTAVTACWVTVDLDFHLNPSIIQGDDDDTFRAVVMPVRDRS